MEISDVCKKQIVPPKTDLKKLSIVTDFGKSLYKYPQPRPHQNFEVFYGNNNKNMIKEIGRGGNGIIYMVSWNKDKIILKYPISEPDHEPDRVVDVLKGYHHHIIPYKLIHDQYGNPFMVMQQANGDVFDLLRYDLASDFRNKMVSYYAGAIRQLWRKRIVFTDMKPENLLYQCDIHPENGGLTLYFGDIGAFSNEGEKEYDYEVKPPESKGVIDKNFCLFTLGLMVIGIYSFRYERVKPGDSKNFVTKFYNPLKEQILSKIKNKDIQKITLRLLSPYKEDRDNLSVNEAVSYLE
jgi:serine/threonine protein kinase